MKYRLYKTADRKDMIQGLSALGGGGLGYLLTRYGMGIKGAGAGIVGAGLGAAAGAGVGSIATGWGRDAEAVDKKNEDAVNAAAEDRAKTPMQNATENYGPLSMSAGGGAGAAIVGRIGYNRRGKAGSAWEDYQNKTRSVADDVIANFADKKKVNKIMSSGLPHGISPETVKAAVDTARKSGKLRGGKAIGEFESLLHSKPLNNSSYKLRGLAKWGTVGAVLSAITVPALLGIAHGGLKNLAGSVMPGANKEP